MGVMALIGLYALLIVACLSIARRADNLFGMLIVMGRHRHVALQILENIGMDCGLMPITGIPLPFVSYGSSFMVVNFALIGLIGSVYSIRPRSPALPGLPLTEGRPHGIFPWISPPS